MLKESINTDSSLRVCVPAANWWVTDVVVIAWSVFPDVGVPFVAAETGGTIETIPFGIICAMVPGGPEGIVCIMACCWISVIEIIGLVWSPVLTDPAWRIWGAGEPCWGCMVAMPGETKREWVKSCLRDDS